MRDEHSTERAGAADDSQTPNRKQKLGVLENNLGALSANISKLTSFHFQRRS